MILPKESNKSWNVEKDGPLIKFEYDALQSTGFSGEVKQFLYLAGLPETLDTLTDNVYIVNFEGGDELLLKGELEAMWPTFYDFLKSYFNC